MNIKTLDLHGSPYIGIFCAVSDEYALVPNHTPTREAKRIEETLNVNVIPTSIAHSYLIGALAKGFGKKFVVADTIDHEEQKLLEKSGIEVHVARGITAIGNLLSVQKHGGIISPLIPQAQAAQISDFFNIPLHVKAIAQNELPGSCVIATERGFLAHPRTEPQDMEWLEKLFKVPGMTTTANYGDAFIGNSILANAHGTLVGERTSGPELARIDEGLHPGLTFK